MRTYALVAVLLLLVLAAAALYAAGGDASSLGIIDGRTPGSKQ